MNSAPDTDANQHFEWSVRALAQAPEVQRGLFPDFVEVADQLALDFDEALRAVRSTSVPWTPGQTSLVETLDRALEAMSGPQHTALWTMHALEHSAEWAELRGLAQKALRLFGWPQTSPPTNRGIFVGQG